MFVVEKFFGDLDAHDEEYQRRAQKWVDEGADKEGYNYRSLSDYKRQYGDSPRTRAYQIAHKVLIGLAILATVFLMTKYISVSVEEDNNKTTNQTQEK